MDFARTKLLVILAAGHLISSSVLKAQACYDYAGTYAKDAKGERHSYKDYPRHRPPWLDDQSRHSPQFIVIQTEQLIVKATVSFRLRLI